MGPTQFLTTGDGILDKRYSNRSRQPNQTFYFSKKGRVNKSHQGKAPLLTPYLAPGNKTEYMIPSANPPKRSGSGKVKKRHMYGKDSMMYELSTGSKKVGRLHTGS